VVYISKEEAAQIFKQEYGEDVGSVLDFNPFPPSFRVILLPDYRTAAHARALNDRLIGTKGVESVVYRRTLLELIDERSATANRLALGFGILISGFAVLLVSNTIRLAIYAKRSLIRTMELVGATRSFIRFPFLLEGLVQGIIGGILAALLFYGVLEYGIAFIVPEAGGMAGMGTAFYGLVVAGGGVLGLVGSAISVIRFIRPAGER
jgi:cell division transport system permease protein